MQRLARLAYRDQQALLRHLRRSVDHVDESLASVAALGGWGASPGNIHRELLRWLGDPEPPKPLQIVVPVKVAKPGRLPVLAETRMGILLPHEEFSQLYANQRAAFNRYVLGADSEAQAEASLQRFWGSLEDGGDPRVASLPMRQEPGWQSKVVPLALHGDAVPCVAVGKPGTKSLDCLSWQSVIASGSTSPA